MKNVAELSNALAIHPGDTPIGIWVQDSEGNGSFQQISRLVLRTDVDSSALYQDRTLVVVGEACQGN
jgi:hypothetical protein